MALCCKKKVASNHVHYFSDTRGIAFESGFGFIQTEEPSGSLHQSFISCTLENSILCILLSFLSSSHISFFSKGLKDKGVFSLQFFLFKFSPSLFLSSHNGSSSFFFSLKNSPKSKQTNHDHWICSHSRAPPQYQINTHLILPRGLLRVARSLARTLRSLISLCLDCWKHFLNC